MKKSIFGYILLLNSVAMAAGGHGADGEGSHFPADTVIAQVVNLGLLIAFLYFWQGKNISKAFKDKRENFLKSVQAASQSKIDAEKKMKEVQSRVDELKSTYQSEVEAAKKNAEESYRTQLANAKNDALRIKETANGSLESEIQKEIENLRLETFKKSAGLAEVKLGTDLSANQQKAWNTHFATEVKGVH